MRFEVKRCFRNIHCKNIWECAFYIFYIPVVLSINFKCLVHLLLCLCILHLLNFLQSVHFKSALCWKEIYNRCCWLFLLFATLPTATATMPKLSKISPKSLLGLVKAKKIFGCLLHCCVCLTHRHSTMIYVCDLWEMLQVHLLDVLSCNSRHWLDVRNISLHIHYTQGHWSSATVLWRRDRNNSIMLGPFYKHGLTLIPKL